MGRGYGQFCPVAKAAEVFCERWNALLLREFGTGPKRFSELRRGVPLMSPSMLSRRLKELEREGVIEKHEHGDTRTYHLTEAGSEFVPLVYALGVWGQRWTRRQLEDGEIDFGLLLWDMERTVRGDAFGDRQTTVLLTFTDLPDGQRDWWFLNDGTRAEVCIEEPGFDVDIYLAASVADMIYIWRGDLTLARAIEDERLEALGARPLVKKLGKWLNLSPLAAIAPAQTNPHSPAVS